MARSGTATKSVFIVEDSAIVRDNLELFLRELAAVDVLGKASKAADAIADIRRLRPDVVTLDLRLAEGSGIDVLREIKSVPNAPLVIVLTNFTDAPYRNHCRKYGADHFFDKACDFTQVIDLIDGLALPV